MVTENEILALVKNYVDVDGIVSLEAFSQSFAELFYDIEKTGDQPAIALSYAIEGALASVSAGVCSEHQLVSGLKSLFPSISVIKISEPVISESGKTQWIVLGTFSTMMGAEKAAVSPVYAGTAPSAGLLLKDALLGSHQTSTGQAQLPQSQEVI
jgi:hypothetical protein